jgi:hypothetical protein
MFRAPSGVLYRKMAATFAVLVGALGVVSDAQTPDCNCPTQKQALYSNHGGDGMPLNWSFGSYDNPQPQYPQQKIICYVRRVQNKSARSVGDVWWIVAHFQRDLIPPNLPPRSTCNNYTGDMKSSLDHGKLEHSVSSWYDTDVRPPESGWNIKKAEAVPPKAVPPNLAPLRSDFILDTTARDGRILTSHISIVSSAENNGEISSFNFNINNDGDATVGVLMNIRSVPSMYKDIPGLETPFYIKPKSREKFKTELASKLNQPESGSATVIFFF